MYIYVGFLGNALVLPIPIKKIDNQIHDSTHACHMGPCVGFSAPTLMPSMPFANIKRDICALTGLGCNSKVYPHNGMLTYCILVCGTTSKNYSS